MLSVSKWRRFPMQVLLGVLCMQWCAHVLIFPKRWALFATICMVREKNIDKLLIGFFDIYLVPVTPTWCLRRSNWRSRFLSDMLIRTTWVILIRSSLWLTMFFLWLVIMFVGDLSCSLLLCFLQRRRSTWRPPRRWGKLCGYKVFLMILKLVNMWWRYSMTKRVLFILRRTMFTILATKHIDGDTISSKRWSRIVTCSWWRWMWRTIR